MYTQDDRPTIEKVVDILAQRGVQIVGFATKAEIDAYKEKRHIEYLKRQEKKRQQELEKAMQEQQDDDSLGLYEEVSEI